MSKQMKRSLLGGSTAVILFTLFLVITLMTPTGGASPDKVRRIELEARDAAFGADNPTLHLEPGERVRLVIRNTDPGIVHSITIPGIDDRVYHVGWNQTLEVDFTVPRSGTFRYICPQHAPKMQGAIVVN